MEVLQTSALPLGDGAPLTDSTVRLKPDTTTYFDCTCGNGSAALKDRTTAFDETRKGHTEDSLSDPAFEIAAKVGSPTEARSTSVWPTFALRATVGNLRVPL